MCCPAGGGRRPPRAQTGSTACNLVSFVTPRRRPPSYLAFTRPFLLFPGLISPALRAGGTRAVLHHGRTDAAPLVFLSYCGSGGLGSIQLIKTQLMFVLMAPQRQPERQASVIPASDEASARTLYGLQMEENSPTMQHPYSAGISLIHTQTFPI